MEVQLASLRGGDKGQANLEFRVFLFDNRQFFSEESAIAFQGARGAVGVAMASLRTENLAVGERVQAIPLAAIRPAAQGLPASSQGTPWSDSGGSVHAGVAGAAADWHLGLA